jgi:FtsH-binding integral membrane protein
MRKAVKILCIIALVVGLIWAAVGFFGVLIGGAAVATFQDDAQSAVSTMEKTEGLMIRHLGGFVVVIIGGVLGIVGSGNESSKMKLMILGILTLISGCGLFPLSNYVAAGLYALAGLLLLLAGLTTKQVENTRSLQSD